MTKLEMLYDKRKKLAAEATAIIDGAKREDERDLTEEEIANLEGLGTQCEEIKTQISAHENAGRIVGLNETPRNGTPKNLSAPLTDESGSGDQVPNPGWKSCGEFFQAVSRARTHGSIDQRLGVGAALTTYGSEGVGADGGFLIPTEFSDEIMKHVLGGPSLLPLTNQVTISGNSMEFATDETTPWGTTGVIAYWEAEAAAGTETKLNLGKISMTLNKLLALAPVTSEMLEDANAVADEISGMAGRSILWKINDAIINGNGAGVPMGIINSGAMVTQAKETSQAADTVNANNLSKMFARVPNQYLQDAVWLINPDVFNQLITMTVGNAPIWTPPQTGMTNAPGGLLLGRPVIMSESCQTLGDLNDIILAGFSQYKTITKAGGIQSSLSVDFYFSQDTPVFKFRFRMNGRPWMSKAITPPNSSVTQSAFVNLAARA